DELPLIQPQFLFGVIDVRVGNGRLDERIGLIAQARCIQRRECQRRGGRGALDQVLGCAHYSLHRLLLWKPTVNRAVAGKSACEARGRTRPADSGLVAPRLASCRWLSSPSTA